MLGFVKLLLQLFPIGSRAALRQLAEGSSRFGIIDTIITTLSNRETARGYRETLLLHGVPAEEVCEVLLYTPGHEKKPCAAGRSRRTPLQLPHHPARLPARTVETLQGGSDQRRRALLDRNAIPVSVAAAGRDRRKRQPAAVPDPPAAHQGFIRHRRTVGRIRPEADRQSRVRSVYRIPRRRLGQLRKRNRRGYFPLTPEQRSRSATRLRAQRRQSFPFETCGFGSIFPALSDDGELRRHTGIFYGATGENASGVPDGICRTAVNIAKTWCFARSCPTDTGRTRNGSSRSEPETTGNLPAVQENQFYRPPCPSGGRGIE